MKTDTRWFICSLFLFTIVILQSLIFWSSSPSVAIAYGNLLTRTPLTTPEMSKEEPKKVGGYIELQIPSGQSSLWTKVQWQDGVGNFNDVESWQGWVDANGRKRWWVEAKHFGNGPFRWVIQSCQTGEFLVTSELFYLPTQANEVIQVTISLP